MRHSKVFRYCCPVSLLLISSVACLAESVIVPVGSGSYTTELPAGVKPPPPTFHLGDTFAGPVPSNDWWSSLVWGEGSFTQFPHPLAVKPEASGLRVGYPGATITANKAAIFGMMPGGADDFILGHSNQTAFSGFKVESASDWFVTVRFGEPATGVSLSYGHGSPYVFGMSSGGNARISFTKAPQIWSGNEASATLGITVNNRHYGLFAPTGSTWKGLGGSALAIEGNNHYFSVATLPDAKPETLVLFQRHAHAHVTNTTISWKYDEAKALMNTEYNFTTTSREGSEKGTLFALYPHQWRNTKTPLLETNFASVRGLMKLGEGTQFTTSMTFPGVLPALPKAFNADSSNIETLLNEDFAKPVGAMADTYWSGKQMGRLATAIPIAEVHGLPQQAARLRAQLQTMLETWLSAADENGAARTRNLFYYDNRVGTLVGYPASYGSDNELNDHHFHYGYFIKAAAELARTDPAWASDAKFGAMVKLLIRDIASPNRDDKQFPFLRCFDPYAGHSWASGHSRFADGNNNESSSEAMNAWCGIILFAEAIGDKALRDLGIYLFTTEMNAIQEYWFDVHGDNFPKDYPASVVTMVWGGKGANGTWFSADPQQVHGINFLPIHGGSLYLGLFPEYAEKNYRALVSEFGSDQFKTWPDVLWMYRALSDPNDAARLMQEADPKLKIEDGNTRANTLHWINALQTLGRPDRSVVADSPIYAVFQKGSVKNYAAYNFDSKQKTVAFTDGHKLVVPAKSLASDSAK